MHAAEKSTKAPDEPALKAYATGLEELARQLQTDRKNGLGESQVAAARERFGRNELAHEPQAPAWRRLLAQFRELVIWILIVAAVISAALGEVVDAVAILAIVLLNGLIGFFQEARAEQALAALRKMSVPRAKVIRGGQAQQLAAAEIVPGDLIELEAGDNVPADARLISANRLQAQESALTGESTPVEKDAAAELPEGTPLGDRLNMAFMGTVVTAGKATALVTATGMQTELGRIAGLLSNRPAEQTPLQRRLAELGRVLVVVCLVLVGIVFLLQLRRGGNRLEIFMVSVSLAVAAVPEGLPAVVTLALALGLQRMAARNALVRKLPSVETLGSVTVICTDKTGTLTRNEMTVRALVTAAGEFAVSGSGYQPEGEFRRVASGGRQPPEPQPQDKAVPSKEPDLKHLLTIAVRCNGARLTKSDKDGQWQIVGDPTEGSLLVAARKGGIEPSGGHEVLSEIPFDSQRKAMSVIVHEGEGREVIYTKGAPEVVLTMCRREFHGGQERPLTEERRQAILKHSAALADQALRVLGFASRRKQDGAGELKEEDLTFAGLAGIIDPPREEARQAIELCRTAGIRPVMITGDHPATARAIARELGLVAEDGGVLNGQELESLSDQQLQERIQATSVYARVAADHKLRVVEAWQKRGQVVAMTGDGVNDAPAVKAADIGIAMGLTGTDVTKEASDMVLTDDNFRTIVSAVEEGRSIFDNIQHIVHYLLSCNAGEVLFMFFSAAAGWPLPLAAIQILWVNLVTDGLPALALALEPPDAGVMHRPPRPPREPVLTLRRGLRILFHGALVAAATAAGFWYVYQGSEQSLGAARTAAFCILAFAQLSFSFACRSDDKTLPELGLFTNPYLLGAIAVSGLLQLAVVTVPLLRPIFNVPTSPTAAEWLVIIPLALAPVTIVEVAKLVWHFFRRGPVAGERQPGVRQ
jgi:Ca2+-transporting ATPase